MRAVNRVDITENFDVQYDFKSGASSIVYFHIL